MFDITSAAIAELRAAAMRSQAEGMALRIAARELADGTVEYGMGFDDEREHDESADFQGLTVLLGARSRPYLAGKLLDYAEVAPGRLDFVFMAQNDATQGARGPDDTNRGGACGGGGCSRCGG
jgi:iron-sulfur cluster assembly protein